MAHDDPNEPRKIDYAKEAKAARDKYRAENDMPEGTQVHHWTKERLAKESGMSPETMNKNLSPMQSRNDGKATTLLTDPEGGPTRYEVGDGKTYGNEHKLADRHMIPTGHERIKAANPSGDPKAAAEAAGGVAKWKMTGDPGNVSKELVEKVDIAKGEKFRPDGPREKSEQGGEVKSEKADGGQSAGEVKRDAGSDAQRSGDASENAAPTRENVKGPDGASAGQADGGSDAVVVKEPASGPVAPPAAGAAPPVMPPIIPPGGPTS
jgi:hypothetical protein